MINDRIYVFVSSHGCCNGSLGGLHCLSQRKQPSSAGRANWRGNSLSVVLHPCHKVSCHSIWLRCSITLSAHPLCRLMQTDLRVTLAFAAFFGTSLVSGHFPALNLHLDEGDDRTLQSWAHPAEPASFPAYQIDVFRNGTPRGPPRGGIVPCSSVNAGPPPPQSWTAWRARSSLA
jgi:hypothetical protein